MTFECEAQRPGAEIILSKKADSTLPSSILLT